jgi:putative ATP-binding cassette transporter
MSIGPPRLISAGPTWYPLSEEDAKDDAIIATLEKVNLHDIFARVGGDLSKVVDWANVLSLGEQQRVAFARLFLKKPVIAFLDEATSTLDEENERFLYEQLRASGIAFVRGIAPVSDVRCAQMREMCESP